jgi:ABC-type protease/lipase transport system fused ATPase/permease subunit
MRKASGSKGYFLCYICNLFLNFEWAVFALILFILHFWLGIPVWLSLIGLGVWLLVALVLTSLVAWGAKSANEPTPERENKNPYSAKTEDMLKPAVTQAPPEQKEPSETETDGNASNSESLNDVMQVFGAFGNLLDKAANLANQTNAENKEAGQEQKTTPES